MPFVRRVVYPEYICRKNSLIGNSEVLIDQNNYTCINFIRQLASLSNHAQDIFHDLEKKLEIVTDRSDRVAQRLENVRKALPSANASIQTNQSDISGGQNQFQITVQIDSMTLVRDAMPAALRKVYESCRKIPDFYLLDAIRCDGKKTSDLYSKPEYFYETWLAKMDKDLEKRKKKKKREKVPKVSEEKPVAELPKSRIANIVEKAKAADVGAIGSIQRPGDIEIKNHISIREDSSDTFNRAESLSNIPPPPNIVPPPFVSNSFSPDPSKLNFSSTPSPPSLSSSDLSPPKLTPTISNESASSGKNYVKPPGPPPPPPCVVPSVKPPTPAPPPPPPPAIPAPPPPPPSVAPLNVPRGGNNISEPDNLPEDPRNELLSSIRGGKPLKKIDVKEIQQKKAATTSVHGMDVATILAERIKVICMSDDDSEEDDEDDEWD